MKFGYLILAILYLVIAIADRHECKLPLIYFAVAATYAAIAMDVLS